jgi:serine protease Do
VAPLSAERLAINDQPAPSGLGDLREIQAHLKAALPRAREATVCIELEEAGSGSGVVISEDGLILTAAHVTGGVGREFTVKFEDGREVKAESLGLNSETDSAMVKIIDTGTYPFVEIDREDTALLGDWVFSLGHSGGFDADRGSVLRLGRLVRTRETTVQSDCNLIGGDSGGPLFDLRGRLIGIHSRVGNRLPENMHVPMREYVKHWEALHGGEFIGEGPFASPPETGKGFLGVLAEAWDGEGIKIERVGRESPAEEAGMKAGDVLLELNGNALSDRDQLRELLGEMAPRDQVSFQMLRDGERRTITLRLGHRNE